MHPYINKQMESFEENGLFNFDCTGNNGELRPKNLKKILKSALTSAITMLVAVGAYVYAIYSQNEITYHIQGPIVSRINSNEEAQDCLDIGGRVEQVIRGHIEIKDETPISKIDYAFRKGLEKAVNDI